MSNESELNKITDKERIWAAEFLGKFSERQTDTLLRCILEKKMGDRGQTKLLHRDDGSILFLIRSAGPTVSEIDVVDPSTLTEPAVCR